MTEVPSRVEKPWGHELILDHNNDFVVKRIFVRSGHRSSLQVHRRKSEWVQLEQGVVELTSGLEGGQLETLRLTAGQAYTVPAGTVHRVLAVEDTLLLEVATAVDDDTERLEDDYGR